jgi:hypothetical protein
MSNARERVNPFRPMLGIAHASKRMAERTGLLWQLEGISGGNE